MKKPAILMMSDAIYEHYSQIYAGFELLHAQGLIELKQIVRDRASRSKAGPTLLVIADNGTRIRYDLFDGGAIRDESQLSDCDYYFKRSLNLSEIQPQAKLFPLGLNYYVHSSPLNLLWLQRQIMLGDSIRRSSKTLLEAVFEASRLAPVFGTFMPTAHNMYQKPAIERDPKILFMTRAWDPDEPCMKDDQKLRDERFQINQTREDCIIRLRKEYGSAFCGGFAPTPYALKRHNNVVLDDIRVTSKRSYIELLKRHSICVATTGLHGSIGWKFGEYVAFSKAIVSEPLKYQVPGNLGDPRNYLTFSSNDELLEQVALLFKDHHLRINMMKNNASYYSEYLRPDRLVFHTLRTAGVFPNDSVSL